MLNEMTVTKQFHPAKAAKWLLNHMGCSPNNAAVIGDLDERYRSGLVDFLNVLETQRSLLDVQDELARSERTMDQNLVRLYKALGGGWEGGTEVALKR